jgi:hypothetical protein
VVDLKERILIEIDPDTGTYSVDYGMGQGGVNYHLVQAVLEHMLEQFTSGSLLEDSDIEVSEEDIDTNSN